MPGGWKRHHRALAHPTRTCKDVDICIVGDDPFACRSTPPMPFFRRYMSVDELYVETTKGWYFYTPPPSASDLVTVLTPKARILCVSPEYLCASHLKAIVEGRTSSTRDVHNTLLSFPDFDHARFERYAAKVPVFQALGIKGVRSIMKAVMEPWEKIREIAVARVKGYYSGCFHAPKAIEAMGESTVRYLASGIGAICMPGGRCKEEMERATDENAFWRALYAGFGVPCGLIERVLRASSSASDEDLRIARLVAIAGVLTDLERFANAARTAGLEGWVASEFISALSYAALSFKGLQYYMVLQFLRNPDYLHPLKHTFSGTIRAAVQRLESGSEFSMMEFASLIERLARDTTKTHGLRLGEYDRGEDYE